MTGQDGSTFRWISSPREIIRLRRTGTLRRGKLLSVWIAPGTDAEGNVPAACVVAGRGFNKAVKRNKAKRRTIGALMDSRGLLEHGRRYLIECRPGAEEEDYQKLVIELRWAISREQGSGVEQ